MICFPVWRCDFHVQNSGSWESERHLLPGGKEEAAFQYLSKIGRTQAAEDLEEQTTFMAEHFLGHGDSHVFNCLGCTESFLLPVS